MRYTPHTGGSNQAASGQTSEAAPDRPGESARLNLSAGTVDSRRKGQYSFWRVVFAYTRYSSRWVPLEFPALFCLEALALTAQPVRSGPAPSRRIGDFFYSPRLIFRRPDTQEPACAGSFFLPALKLQAVMFQTCGLN
jgi:hypothetical protein